MRHATFVLCALMAGCGGGGGDQYTLYRNSILDANLRIHIATFDTSDGDAYNNENCNLAARLFQQQPEVKARFWCEKGTFKK